MTISKIRFYFLLVVFLIFEVSTFRTIFGQVPLYRLYEFGLDGTIEPEYWISLKARIWSANSMFFTVNVALLVLIVILVSEKGRYERYQKVALIGSWAVVFIGRILISLTQPIA